MLSWVRNGQLAIVVRAGFSVPLEMISRFTLSDPTKAGTAAGAHQTQRSANHDYATESARCSRGLCKTHL